VVGGDNTGQREREVDLCRKRARNPRKQERNSSFNATKVAGGKRRAAARRTRDQSKTIPAWGREARKRADQKKKGEARENLGRKSYLRREKSRFSRTWTGEGGVKGGKKRGGPQELLCRPRLQ